MKMRTHILILLILIAGLTACNQENGNTEQSTSASPDAVISQPPASPVGIQPPYVIKDSSSVQLLEEGVQLYVIEEGSGAIPKPGANVFINYHGMLTDGTVFDSSFDRGTPNDFSLQQLIRGWQIGLTSVKSGSKIKLIVPPEVGYGAQGSATIPPNSTLIFDIELISTY